MPLLTTSVPNLVQGVSQQPDNLRYPGQAEEQVNAYSSVVDGLTKRPNTHHVKDLFSATEIPDDSLVHFVDRDSDNQHVMVFANNGGTADVSIFNVSLGASINVSISADAQTYLNTATTPLKDLRALTVADYTFVANKQTTVAMDATTSAAQANEALVFVKQGDYEKKYAITIDDVTYSITSGAASAGGDEADSHHIGNELDVALGSAGTSDVLASVTVAGTGTNRYLNYGATPPVVTFSGGGGSGATATATLTWWGGSRVVDTIVITNGGSGYSSAPTVLLNGTTASYATAVLGTGGTFGGTVTNESGVLLLTKTTPFTATVSDGLSNTGLGIAHKEVAAITDLPVKCYNGFRVKVRGDVSLSQDDYYVKFETKDDEPFGEGAWKEDVGYEVKTILDAATMPIQIVPAFTSVVSHGGSIYKSLQAHTSAGGNEPGTGGGAAYWVEDTSIKDAPAWSSGTVSYNGPQDGVLKYFIQTVAWASRQAGDDDTNAAPTLVDNKINDVFFFKNRLGFLTDGSVVFSEGDEYFNFWRTTTQTLLDGDPIDVGVAHTKVSTLKHAVPFQEKLVLFSPQSQFVLRGTDLLTPKTVNISPITEYDVSSDVTPLALTNYVYFPFSRANFEGMYEFYVDATTDVFDAAEVTAQTPKYVPTTLRQLLGTPAEDVIVATSSSNLKHLYVYKYFWQNKEKIQSSWSRFEFANDVVGAGFIDSDLYLVTTDGTNTNLERMSMESGVVDTGKDYAILLDRRVPSSDLGVSYSAASKKTTVTSMPYDPANSVVYTAAGERYAITRVNSSSFTVVADLSSTDFYVGLEYDMEYTFSTQTLKQPTERGGKATSNFTYQTLRNGAIDYADTGHFTVEVTPLYRDTYSYAFNPAALGASSLLGSLVVDSGSFRFPIHAKHDEATIKVKSSSALPAKLLAAEFESFVTPRSRRYGS